jgi:hypothetical protein
LTASPDLYVRTLIRSSRASSRADFLVSAKLSCQMDVDRDE